MRSPRLSYFPLLWFDILDLSDLSPLIRVNPVRLDHIRRFLNNLQLLLRIWREFVAYAIDFQSPVLDLAEDVDLFGRIDWFAEVLQGTNDLAAKRIDAGVDFRVELVALTNGERRGEPVDVFEGGRHGFDRLVGCKYRFPFHHYGVWIWDDAC